MTALSIIIALAGVLLLATPLVLAVIPATLKEFEAEGIILAVLLAGILSLWMFLIAGAVAGVL